MKYASRLLACALLVGLFGTGLAAAAGESPPIWPQWGQNPQHEGTVPVVGQSLDRILADVLYDPFVDKENRVEDGLSVHYQTPLLDGQDVYMEFKTGNFSSLKNWETQTWNQRKLSWENGQLVTKWNFESDWKPVPFASNQTFNGPTWEPVYHAALANGFLYDPGFGGTIFKLAKETGSVVARINPFGPGIDRDVFVSGPLSVDTAGNIYYNAMKLDHDKPWDTDVLGAWLVKVAPNDTVTKATWASLTPGTPAGTDLCTFRFSLAELPWPPSPDAVPPNVPCGSQRPGVNVAPAIAPDGTIYDVSRAQFLDRWGFLIAVNPDLTPKWVASLRERFNDGCNLEIPPNGTPGGCREGAKTGVEPSENQAGSGRVLDEGTSSPTVAPDGSVWYGAYTRYNYAQGHLMHFARNGRYLGAYHFGWDITPGIYRHDLTYSVVIKENHYGEVGSYCNDPVLCPPDRNANDPTYPEEYFITQLSPRLAPEWMFKNTNTLNCTRDASGSVTCVDDHPHSFEWCVNAPAIDPNGTVYANSEDGRLYAVNQGGTLKQQLFLELSVPAAYTPLSIANDGKIYAQNFGHLTVVGSG